MTIDTQLDADRELKAKHRAMWALGDYHAVARDVISATGPALVRAAGITGDQRVLDVAAGSGNASVPAARTGASVVASDLTPELLEEGRHAHPDVDITWEVGDAEALPYGDGSFDAVISCVGVMFAPHHQQAADELVRVTRRGGTIANLSWTPAGFIGQMFATMKPFAPAPPPGAQPPPLWGDATHVRTLLGDRVTNVTETVEELTVDAFTSARELVDFFKACYGPTIAVFRSLGDDAEKVAALDAALVDLAARFGADSGTLRWEYLIVTAVRA
ncbi:class I SAM-dependent methyltransferase [Nocardioides sp.]|uniref:class I SAM-dependent methyltransferase n=1 Tax=Nocardioides sp. TaxID=35761 RepID=UPI002ED27D09